MAAADQGYLPVLNTRDEYVDWLEGYSLPAIEDELQAHPLTRKPVKTYMLETVRDGWVHQDVATFFPRRVQMKRLDDHLYRVHDSLHSDEVVGLLELIDDRHPVFFTTLAVAESDRWVRQVVDSNPWLDRLWLSSPILFEIWQYIQRTTPSHRYVRLGFDHEAWYESSEEPDESDVEATFDPDQDEDLNSLQLEHRRSKVHLTERLGVLQDKLPHLMALYDPLQSLVQVQVPSGGRGGHMLYYDGKATNRSESFAEHRGMVELILRLYRTVTEHAEEMLWVHTSEAGEEGFSVEGAPVLIEFENPLPASTFDRFINLGLRRKTSRFRIGGFVEQRGPTKVHVTAIDRHLWQPFLLEVTTQHMLAVLPRGTCGNSVHRLVTNVQRFLDPAAKAWLGSESYSATVSGSMPEK